MQTLIFLIIMVSMMAQAVAAEEQEDILRAYGSEEMVSLATGYIQPLSDAPAVINVITSREIERLGALTVAQVLETVPGLHVSTARGFSDVFIIRGLFREFNSQVLLLINGIPVNDVVNGGRPQTWSMPVHDIARIEIIRGPVSALYGADAMAGVINIITKTSRDIKDTEVGTYAGSFQTYGGWLLSSGHWGDIDTALYFEGSTTNGYKRTIKADNQTSIDTLLGTDASLAPGHINTGRDDINARLDIKGQHWLFRMGYQGFLNVGTGAGSTLALDPHGDFNVNLTSADFTYNLFNSAAWAVDAQLSYLGSTLHANLTPYPPGAFGGIFTAGVQERFRFRVNQERAELNALYQGIRNHRLRMGIGTTLAEVSDVNEKRNFIIGLTGRPRPLSRLTDIDSLDLEPFLSEKQRTVEYAFLQDEWRFAPDWTLTAGGRFDHYSDFGSTFNPRLSLVWNLSPSLTSKLLYGRSFRAPSFTELYGNSQLALVGDPHLKPETLDMIQFVLAKQWGRAVSTSINLFWYNLNDQIRGEVNPATPASPVQVVNGAGLNGHGLEVESRYRFTERISLSGSYAYQRAEDKQYHQSPGQAPEHQLYGELNWQLTPDWALNSHLKWIGARQRPPGYKGQVDAYTLVGVTLRRFDSENRWEAALSINNLLNADAREPSFYPTSLPYDIPLAGRNMIGQFKVRF